MTAEEIKNAAESSKTEAGWLREIAYQLALLNDKPEKNVIQVGQRKPK